MKIGVVTGLRQEIKCLPVNKKDYNFQVMVSGANSDHAEDVAETLIKEGCDALLSYGFSGGLDPKLDPGDLIIADKVFSENGHVFFTNKEWREKILDFQPVGKAVYVGSVVGLDYILQSAYQKTEAYTKYSALAVDMESHRIGLVAKNYNIPFLVIRTILDSANMAIPRSIINVIDCNGNTNYLSIILNIIKNPNHILELRTLAKCQRLASKSLEQTTIFEI